MAPKTVLGVLLLVLAAAVVVGAALLSPRPGDGNAGAHAVEVVGRDGRVVFEGTVEAATALEALEAAARLGGFAVEKESYPNGVYVVAVDGERAEGSKGWVYEIRRDGATRFGDVSADLAGLAPGDAVVWRWSERP